MKQVEWEVTHPDVDFPDITVCRVQVHTLEVLAYNDPGGVWWADLGMGGEYERLQATDAASAQQEALQRVREWLAGVAAGLGLEVREKGPASQAEHLFLCALLAAGGSATIPNGTLASDFAGWLLSREEDPKTGGVRFWLEPPVPQEGDGNGA